MNFQHFRKNLVINDIDKPLYKYGMIYKYDINNYYLDNPNLMKKQRMISLAIISFMIFNSIKFFIFISLLDNERVPDYCFDFIQEVGGLIIYFYIANGIISAMSVGFSYHFNTGNEEDMKWLEIIKCLKGVLPIHLLRIHERSAIEKFFIHVKKIYVMTNIMTKSAILSISLMIVIIIIFKYDFNYFIKFGFISSILFYLYVYYVASFVYYGPMYFFIVCYYCKMRMQSINNKLKKIFGKIIISKSSIDNLLEDHNQMCNTIIIYNKFWNKILQLIILSMIPFNLIYLHQIFFEDLPKQTIFATSTVLLFTSFFLLTMNTITAVVHKEVLKSYKLFNKILIKLGNSKSIKRKIKV